MGGKARREVIERLRQELARRGAGWASWGADAAAATSGAGAAGGRVEVASASELVAAVGGWPPGALVGVWGPGRTHVALTAMAGCEAPVAWIDLHGGFFPPGAARLGVALDRLLWVRPKDVGEALWAAHIVLSGGAFERVVVDLGDGAVDRRVERALPRLARDAQGSGGTALLVSRGAIGGVTLVLALEQGAGGLVARWRLRRGAGLRQGEVVVRDPVAGALRPGARARTPHA